MNSRPMLRGGGALVIGGLLLTAIDCQQSQSHVPVTTPDSSTTGTEPSGAAGSGATSGTAGSGVVTGAAGSAGASAGGAGATGLGGAGGATTGAGGAGGAAGTTRDAGVTVDGGSSFDGAVFYITADDGSLYAYQAGGTWPLLKKWTGLPITDGVRGSDADPNAGVLYLTHGGAGPASNGAPNKNGSLLAWDLYANKVIYDVHFTHGVDQFAFGDGVVYVPTGEYSAGNSWYYARASDGVEMGFEPGGQAPHDTLFKNSHRYYGGTKDTYLYVLGLPITKVGPSPSSTLGVRPYTVNAKETRAYITWSAYRGFSVGDLTTGKIITSVNFGQACNLAAPSHGMSMSPDGSEIYVLDTCINQVKVYDTSDNPQMKAAIPFAHKMYPGTESPCAWDCDKDGWLAHSMDGKYVYIANSGDIIDTTTRQPTAYLDTLANCRHGFLEMAWNNGVITGTSTHSGTGQ